MPYSINSVVLAENTLRSTPAQIHALSVPHVGNRTHLVHDGASALVIDAPRDLALVERTADALGVPIVAVADTHVHNDYVSGAAALAERHGADYLLSARERVDVHRLPVHGGDLLWLGGLQIEVLDTPGHTAHHQSFLVRHGAQRALFSGGSLLHGTVGRTDLVDPALTVALAGEQWDSARRQGALPRDTGLFPTHGFGSFCAGGCVAEGPRGLIAHEHGDDHSPANESLVRPREEFVRTLVAGYGPIPAYYRHMAPLNRAGAGRHAAAAPRAVAEGCVLDAARELGDIGVEVAATHVLGPAETWLDRADYRVVDWERFAASDPVGRVTLDVRHDGEFAESHLAGAFHVPLPALASALDRVPPGEVWVHCHSGFRAAIAASLLARAGRRVVLVTDDWDRLGDTGLALVGVAA